MNTCWKDYPNQLYNLFKKSLVKNACRLPKSSHYRESPARVCGSTPWQYCHHLTNGIYFAIHDFVIIAICCLIYDRMQLNVLIATMISQISFDTICNRIWQRFLCSFFINIK